MRTSSPAGLVPPFREAVATLVQHLKAGGFKPHVHETYRSPKRAKELVDAGRSRARGGLSMHCYGMAADIICADHLWSCEARDCAFYEALGREARALGMTWGGDWDGDGVTREQREHDLPHVQAVPFEAQAAVRRGKPKELTELAERYLGGGNARP
jgi:hypothetical protein